MMGRFEGYLRFDGGRQHEARSGSSNKCCKPFHCASPFFFVRSITAAALINGEHDRAETWSCSTS
jgi:hypothetical protein